MKKYISVLISFITIIATTFTLVQTGYYRDTLHIVLPGRLDYGQWLLVYFNLAVFGYTMAVSPKWKKAIWLTIADVVVTMAFVVYYYSYLANL